MSARPGDAGGRGDSAHGPASRAGRWLAIDVTIEIFPGIEGNDHSPFGRR